MQARIFVATRASRSAAFGLPAQVLLFSNPGQGDVTPFIVPNQLTLYFASSRNVVSHDQLFVTTRVNTMSAWSLPSLVISDTADRRYPYLGPDGRLWFAEVSPDGGASAIGFVPNGAARRLSSASP